MCIHVRRLVADHFFFQFFNRRATLEYLTRSNLYNNYFASINSIQNQNVMYDGYGGYGGY